MADPNEALVEAMARAMCRDQYPSAPENDWMTSAKCWRWELFLTQVRAILPLIEAREQAVKEACAKVADEEVVDYEATKHPEDYAYNQACRDVATAIRSLDLRAIHD